ncbi:MAG: single-stranded DNA-binding protein [Bacteroidales bacterium]|nr:single-stranded DNA-binding protein [Bacteroidales bacterium]
MALNKVMLIGNVGNDPEVRYLESNPQNPATNAKVASFRLATTERFRDRNGELRENTEWHSIVVWRSNADLVEKYVHKGSQIYIEGKLRTRQWTDQTGAKRYTTEVVGDTIQLLGKRPEGDQQPGAGYQGGYSSAPAAAPVSGGYSGPGYGAPAAAPAPGYAPAPAPVQAPVASAPVQPAAAPQPQVSPDYQGPLPSPEPTDDLPF